MTTLAPARPTWAHPDAHRILPTDAPRHEWLTARRQGIGGSDASTIAGVGYGSLFELWLDKTGRLPDEPETPAMRFGRLAEPLLRDAFTAETSNTPHPLGIDFGNTYLFVISCLCLYSVAHLMRLATEAADDARSIV